MRIHEHKKKKNIENLINIFFYIFFIYLRLYRISEVEAAMTYERCMSHGLWELHLHSVRH